jgi:hypothetical protein
MSKPSVKEIFFFSLFTAGSLFIESSKGAYQQGNFLLSKTLFGVRH